MASPARRLPANVPGDVYVDASCIDCDTCRWMAPETFDRVDGRSRVHTQPADPVALDRALAALVACPTASIGTLERHDVAAVVASFPRRVAGEVYHCGFHAESSYGAAAWLVRRPEGNVLVDSPRFAAPLVRAIEALGGVRWMFLTHRDDVADHARWAARFGCERLLHRADVGADTRDVERPFDAAFELAPGVLVLPTPGHTRGSACLLVDDTFLLTGDTLAWDRDLPDGGGVYAFEDATWHDRGVLRASLAALLDRTFAWVLPGHGAPGHASSAAMRASLRACVARVGPGLTRP